MKLCDGTGVYLDTFSAFKVCTCCLFQNESEWKYRKVCSLYGDGCIGGKEVHGCAVVWSIVKWLSSMLDLHSISKNQPEMNLNSVQLLGLIGRACGENGHGDA